MIKILKESFYNKNDIITLYYDTNSWTFTKLGKEMLNGKR